MVMEVGLEMGMMMEEVEAIAEEALKVKESSHISLFPDSISKAKTQSLWFAPSATAVLCK